jgi:hypothetical protein
MDFYAIYYLKYDKYEAQHDAGQPQIPEILVSSGVDYEEDLLHDENKGIPWNSGFICVLKPTGRDGTLDHSVLQNESIQLQISYNARIEILEHIIHFNLPAVSTVCFHTTSSAAVPANWGMDKSDHPTHSTLTAGAVVDLVLDSKSGLPGTTVSASLGSAWLKRLEHVTPSVACDSRSKTLDEE